MNLKNNSALEPSLISIPHIIYLKLCSAFIFEENGRPSPKSENPRKFPEGITSYEVAFRHSAINAFDSKGTLSDKSALVSEICTFSDIDRNRSKLQLLKLHLFPLEKKNARFERNSIANAGFSLAYIWGQLGLFSLFYDTVCNI